MNNIAADSKKQTNAFVLAPLFQITILRFRRINLSPQTF